MMMDFSNDNPLYDAVVAALKTVFDPEIPVNIFDLGLIYGIDIDNAGFTRIKMTLTAPNCPVAETLPQDVSASVSNVTGITGCEVEIVFEPPWDADMISPAAKLELGLL